MKRILSLFLIGFAVATVAFSFDAIITLYMMENGFAEGSSFPAMLFSTYGVMLGMLIVFGVRTAGILSLTIAVYAVYYVFNRPEDLQPAFLFVPIPWAIVSFYAFTHNFLLLVSGFHLPHAL